MLRYHTRRPAVHHRHAESARVARLALIVNIGDAAFWTILPIHLVDLAGGGGGVGLYLAAIAVVGAVVAILSSSAFRRGRKVVLGAASLVVMTGLLAGMSAADDLWLFAVFDVPRSAAFVVITIVLGLLVHDTAKASELSIAEGRFYQFGNIGWLIGPVLAGYVARFFGTEAVFIVVGFVFATALAYLSRLHISAHPGLPHRGGIEDSGDMLARLRTFLSVAALRRVFVLALGLELWWVVSSIYIPIAITDLGFGPDVVGWIVTAGVLPLVVLEPLVGAGARRRGTRPYLIVGFLSLAIGALSFVVLGSSPSLLFFMFAAVNIGAAMIEPLKDTYFFTIAEDLDADEQFGIYNASTPLAGLLGPLVGAAALGVGLGLDGVWVATALLMALCARAAMAIDRGN